MPRRGRSSTPRPSTSWPGCRRSSSNGASRSASRASRDGSVRSSRRRASPTASAATASSRPSAPRSPRSRPRMAGMDSWSLAIIAALVLGYAGLSRRLERTVFTAPMVFVAAGLLVGTEVLGWLDLGLESSAVRTLAEATLTLVLFADASRIDLTALRREIALPARLLGIGLPLTIAAGTVIAAALLTQLTWLEALVLAIALAPTDAALGQAVVTDRRLPVRIRQGMNVESGLNDGICVPLLFIALAAAEADENASSAHHAVNLVMEEIGWGLVGGIAAGALGALVLAFAERRRLVADD